ncbi:hypothetical protein C2845_PM06G31120 [Panicum miliaceum]|uniref:Uncharacterized protein n=1 Tax=Panicum miliaceum TaxID=4540 RepID=A0A3L6R668_PANMI|nr:hypothetical protein C2845_PM06G31120 [Panicum miliaceum]
MSKCISVSYQCPPSENQRRKSSRPRGAPPPSPSASSLNSLLNLPARLGLLTRSRLEPQTAGRLCPTPESPTSDAVASMYHVWHLFLSDPEIFSQVTYPGAGNQKEGRSKSILRDVFIAHVLVKNGNFRQKCIYTGVMLRRMMDAILNADTFDDKASSNLDYVLLLGAIHKKY